MTDKTKKEEDVLTYVLDDSNDGSVKRFIKKPVVSFSLGAIIGGTALFTVQTICNLIAEDDE